MQIFRDRELKEKIELTEAIGKDKHFKLDFGVVRAGEYKILEFYIFNERDSELQELNLVLKPVIETTNGKERDYTKCLQEITISQLPSKLSSNRSHLVEITYQPKIEFFRGLKFDLEINCRELVS